MLMRTAMTGILLFFTVGIKETTDTKKSSLMIFTCIAVKIDNKHYFINLFIVMMDELSGEREIQVCSTWP